eukprot:scaffold4158_cov130-Isochrysis_galbana.AAC.1
MCFWRTVANGGQWAIMDGGCVMCLWRIPSTPRGSEYIPHSALLRCARPCPAFDLRVQITI